MASEREWQLLTAERFLREDAPREEQDLPTNKCLHEISDHPQGRYRSFFIIRANNRKTEGDAV